MKEGLSNFAPEIERSDEGLETLSAGTEEVASAIDEISAVAEQVEQKIENAGGQISPELRAELKEFERKAKGFMYSLCAMFGLLATYGTTASKIPEQELGYPVQEVSTPVEKAPKDSVLEMRTNDGTRFEHSDTTTTRVLNYLAGRDTLPEEDVTRMFKASWKEDIDKANPKTTVDLQKIGIEEAATLAANNGNRSPKWKVWWKEIYMNKYKKFPRFLGAKKEIYGALWQIEKETGSPKIRVMEDLPEIERSDRVGYYDPRTNTIVVSITALGDYKQGKSINAQSSSTLFGEMAHAEQHSKRPEETVKQHNADITQRYTRAEKLKISPDSSQKLEYSTPGTVEYEAHKIIEPRLKQRFTDLVTQIQAQKNNSKSGLHR
jgi:hypothetical protein